MNQSDDNKANAEVMTPPSGDYFFFAQEPSRETVRAEGLLIDIDGWEGPLDLLLDLVEQYLGFINHARHFQLELAADYLVMAAWLAYLKSALLLPSDPEIEPSPEELAMRLQLRLQRLLAMREAAARLMARDRLGRDVFAFGRPAGLRTVKKTRFGCSLFDLLEGYGRVTMRNAPSVHMVKSRRVMTLDDALARLSYQLGTALDWTVLEAFLPRGAPDDLRRSAKASTFAAVLELARTGKLDMQQDGAFAPLMLKVCA